MCVCVCVCVYNGACHKVRSEFKYYTVQVYTMYMFTCFVCVYVCVCVCVCMCVCVWGRERERDVCKLTFLGGKKRFLDGRVKEL